MAYTEAERQILDRARLLAHTYTEVCRLVQVYVRRNPPRNQEDEDLLKLIIMTMGSFGPER
jgi:hypothetical protein